MCEDGQYCFLRGRGEVMGDRLEKIGYLVQIVLPADLKSFFQLAKKVFISVMPVQEMLNRELFEFFHSESLL